DFANAASWPSAAGRALQMHPQPIERVDADRQRRMIERVIADVVATDLGNGVQLSQVGRAKRLVELEFSFPASGLRAADLNGLLREHGYRMPPLSFGQLDGYLKGFIDLVFEHDRKFYLLDWKSNHLGMQRA